MTRAFWTAAVVVTSLSMSPCLTAGPQAMAQEASTPLTVTEEPEAAVPTTGYYDMNGDWIPPFREKAPDTDNCPQATWPPEPVSTSERVTPAPTPLEVVYDGPCGVIAADGYTVPDDVLASAWLVADIDSGEVVAMKDPHGRYRPASIIKVLLALVAIDELDLDAPVPVSAESAGQEGSAAGIGEGGEYTVGDMLHGLLLASGNDTAHALAQKLGGDSMTLLKINEKAKELGMADTRAASYSGLDGPGMSTSAWDMGLAYRAAFENPTFARIVDTQSYDFPGYGDLPSFALGNDNKLYLNDPDGIGGKTGFTDDANHTFVGAVDHDGRRLMAIVLDTTINNGYRAWEQAQMLLHAAYDVDDSVAELEPVSKDTEETAEASDDADAPAAEDSQAGESSVESRYPWLPIGIVTGVAALALLAIWLNRRVSRSR